MTRLIAFSTIHNFCIGMVWTFLEWMLFKSEKLKISSLSAIVHFYFTCTMTASFMKISQNRLCCSLSKESWSETDLNTQTKNLFHMSSLISFATLILQSWRISLLDNEVIRYRINYKTVCEKFGQVWNPLPNELKYLDARPASVWGWSYR